jgi:hypothetical protein
MSIPDDAVTRAGQILYRELPEEYRYRDPAPEKGELGDLESYLHGFGHMLDLIRATTEQAHADAFAEETDTGHSIQPWLLPYLAELVGAELLAPDPDRRREELNNSVLWSKSKGTLHNVDHVGDVISGAETVVQEGWRHTLTCPRPGLPPFSVPALENGDTTGHTPMPLGCPDFRASDRAVQDPDGSNPLYRLRLPGQDPDVVHWKPRAIGGVPCFPGSFADATVRCPDLRDVELTDRPGPHPGRSLIHIRPPDGMFVDGMVEKTLNNLALLDLTDGLIIDPAYVLEKLGEDTASPPPRLRLKLKADLTIPANMSVTLKNICIVGTRVQGANRRPVRLRVSKNAGLIMLASAAQDVFLLGNGAGDDPARPVLDANDSIFGTIIGPNRFARLIYCTVMGETDLSYLHASDCLLSTLSSNLKCNDDLSCIRYSRFTPLAGAEGCFSKGAPTNTNRAPRLIRRYIKDADGNCALQLPGYGAPGYGVLDVQNSTAISAGAEDEGELGAYHALHFAAQMRALRKKLSAYLPLGQEIALAYDPLLALIPPTVAPGDD